MHNQPKSATRLFAVLSVLFAMFLLGSPQALAGGWCTSVNDAKTKAKTGNRPLLIMYSRSTCTNCATAYSNLKNSSAFTKFLQDNNIFAYKYNNDSLRGTYDFTYDYVNDGTSTLNLPSFILLHVRDSSSATNGKFEPGKDVDNLGCWAGSLSNTVSQLTSQLTTALKKNASMFTAPEEPEEPEDPGNDPGEQGSTLAITSITVSTTQASVSTELNTVTARGFKFSATSGKLYSFSATNYSTSTDIQLIGGIYAADSKGQPTGNPVLTIGGQGFAPLASTVRFLAPASKTYVLKLERSGAATMSGLNFKLTHKQSTPASSSSSSGFDPQTYTWSTSVTGAKKTAQQYNRPLLLMYSRSTCTNCATVYSNLKNSTEFMSFLANNAIVAYKYNNDSLRSTYDMTQDYVNDGTSTLNLPSFLFVRVRETANANKGTFSPETDVELLGR